MLLLLAAGLAAQGARYLVQADVLPSLGPQVWDTSHILSERSLLGQMLHTLVGYDATPSGMQIVFYLGTAILIAAGMLKWNGVRAKPALSH
jgi:high-affinity iron transporter